MPVRRADPGPADRLAAKATGCEAFIVEGGIDAWKRAGLPMAENPRPPLELMRQVQIAAGGMAVLGVALGALVSPPFHGLAGFVGAGLAFAGLTGLCPMARLLLKVPSNRAMATSA